MQVLPSRTDTIDRVVLSGLAVSAILLLIILHRYPIDAHHLKLGALSLAILVAVAALVLSFGKSAAMGEPKDKGIGAYVGLVSGVLWILEISFNNFVDPAISTGGTRFYVDNGVWAAINLMTITTSTVIAFQKRAIAPGIRIGIWSGLVSGLLSCLMGLSLVVFWMRFLLRDPINLQEFAARGAGAPMGNMAGYFAYETTAGSLGHLLVIGLGMGLLFGLMGGLIGRVLAKLRART